MIRTLTAVLLLSTLLSGSMAIADAGLSRADRHSIQGVIAAQIKAFQADDEAVAFGYATPGVRQQFGSASAFMSMVRQGFALLYRNRSTAFLEAAVIEGAVIQPLRIVQRDGDVVVALYSMERQANGEWRIAGCELAPSELQAA